VPIFQWPVGKWPTAVVLAALGFTPSCTPGSAAIPGAAVAPAWSGNETAAYRTGHKDGSGDKRQERPHAPRPVSGSTRADYLLGYQHGYRHPHDNPWSRPRAYQLGYRQGERDRRAGHPAEPDREAGCVPRSVREEFRRGYRDGRQ
jgi:hypothetical protein